MYFFASSKEARAFIAGYLADGHEDKGLVEGPFFNESTGRWTISISYSPVTLLVSDEFQIN